MGGQMDRIGKRGRIAGQGKFAGGRPAGSPNKKGRFETSLPPVRCSVELKAYYQQKAQAADQDLSTYLRTVLTLQKGRDGEQSFAPDPNGRA